MEPPKRADETGQGTTTSTSQPTRTFTIAVTGDLLSHGPVVRRARANGSARGEMHDFRPMFAEVASVLSGANVAICHLETPLSSDNRNLSSYPRFSGPRELATAIAAAGYDGCSTASNHSLDKGEPGVMTTLDVLESARLGHSGTARRPEDASRAALYNLSGVTVAHLSYTYGLNPGVADADKPWLANVISVPRIISDSRAARAAGAGFVLVSLHWGAEHQVMPTPEQRSIAQQLLAAPEVDAIVGHHAHAVQPVERISGKIVAYGLGNFLSAQSPRCCPPSAQDGVVLILTVEQGGHGSSVKSTSYFPTWVEPTSYQIVPVAAPSANPRLSPSQRSLMEASRRRTSHALVLLGVPVTELSASPGT